ncbi:acylglycerol kinase family protein [Parvularcula maris]|uniref:Acylglycerol kinase family protein n=1 Tax=Parvularcula maris TaxID=2965077 RepID=A0A9X2RL06_9PROT|nr:acylglycerol kinase family protein [Parvularcula maris]MCQ8186333.1 acylglycerol kinase family protein [Parvularcula maris]
MSLTLMVINPLAGRVARGGSLLAALKGRKDEIIEPDFSRLTEQLRPYLERVETIAVEGGDGTVTGVAHALLEGVPGGEPLPRLIIVPGGTTDLVASVLGMSRSEEKIAKLIAGTGRDTNLPALRLVLSSGETRTGFFLASGSIPRAAIYCREVIHERGVTGMGSVALAVLSSVLGSKEHRRRILAPTPFRMDTDSTSEGPEHRFSILTTLPHLTGKFAPFWGSGEGPINMLMAKAESRNLTGALAKAAVGAAGPGLEKYGYVSERVEAAAIEHDGTYLLDGEMFESATLQVTTSRPLIFRTSS